MKEKLIAELQRRIQECIEDEECYDLETKAIASTIIIELEDLIEYIIYEC